MIVIGSGPAGQKAAIQAAKFRRRVALVERRHMVGGVCTNTGTIPSKTLREAVVYLDGLASEQLYGQSYQVKDDITIEDLFRRTHAVIQAEIGCVRNQLARNHVLMLHGEAASSTRTRSRSRSASDNERTRHGRVDRDRRRHAPDPADRRSSSTIRPCSTPTASCSYRTCRARSSSSAAA